MISISQHIQYLVSRHDCVVVPRLGAFIVQKESARVDAENRLLPPSRSISFNGAITHDDGLLVGSIARREGISYEAAREEVAMAVELLRRRLEIEESVEISRIGRIGLTSDGAFEFTPAATDGAWQMCCAGLPSFILRPLVAEEPAADEPILLPAPRRRVSLRSIGKYAAAVMLLIGLGVTFTTPILVDETEVVKASSAPRMSAPKAVRIEPVVKSAEKPQPAAAPAPVEKLSPIITAPEYEATSPEGYNCFVVVASLASEREANRYLSANPEAEKLGVIKADGRHRVYVAVSNDYDAAYDFKSTDSHILNAYPTAWVYQMNR